MVTLRVCAPLSAAKPSPSFGHVRASASLRRDSWPAALTDTMVKGADSQCHDTRHWSAPASMVKDFDVVVPVPSTVATGDQ